MSNKAASHIRIVLIHATPIAMPAIIQAFKVHWPQAEPVNLLDEGLSLDILRTGGLNQNLEGRIAYLAQYGLDIGAKGIIFTCSAFGPAIENVKTLHAIPILKPDEAMFDSAMRCGSKVGLIATFEPAIEAAKTEFQKQASMAGLEIELEITCLPKAREALLQGDLLEHDSIIARAAAKLGDLDAIMLAHFSMASALRPVRAETDYPVFASPQSAVAAMRAMLNQ